MPVLYSGVVDEHITVREAVALFDVSHMGELRVRGPEAFAFLQYITSNNIAKLYPGKAQYTLLLNESGGVVDDIIVYMFAENDYFPCVNAANTAKDFAWLKKHNTYGAELIDQSNEYAQIAVQGPKARGTLAQLLGSDAAAFSIESFPSFTFQGQSLNLQNSRVELLIASTGYTGEDGFEIFCAPEHAISLWDALLSAGSAFGIKPAGLGARDSLRLEACFPLHGHELADSIPALSANVAWAIKFSKGDFLGKEALLGLKEKGVSPKLVGFEVVDPGIAREGSELFFEESKVGLGRKRNQTAQRTEGRRNGLCGFPVCQYRAAVVCRCPRAKT